MPPYLPFLLLAVQVVTLTLIGVLTWQSREIRRQDKEQVAQLAERHGKLHEKVDRFIEAAPERFASKNDHLLLAATVDRKLDAIYHIVERNEAELHRLLGIEEGKERA